MALVLAPAGLWVVNAGGWPLVIATAACGVIASVEWVRMTTRGLHLSARIMLGVIVATGSALAVWRAGAGLEAGALVSLVTAVAAGTLATVLRGQALSLAFGALYCSLPFAAFAWIRFSAPDGVWLMFGLLAIVWATDIAAYFAGRGFGGPLLSRKDSPHKTWTGAIGAVFCAGLAAAAFVRWRGADEALVHWVVFAIVISAIAQAGDLLESRFKRLYGVKDTSGIIPGHGGVLDRLDALMAASLMVALAVRFAPGLVPGFPAVAE
jgi:phosphatidate cytidylyltransferase